MTEFVALFQSEGLIGLVVGSLLFLIFVFLFIVEKRDKTHNKFVTDLLKESREERTETNVQFTRSSDKLSDAITDLTKNLRDERGR